MTNREVIAAWDAHAARTPAFGEQGDFAREHVLNPALFAELGPLAGLRLLDAGCGGGYLCRLLARAGAIVTGIEPAPAYVGRARAEEAARPLGIRYLQADLSTFAGEPEAFDAVVANMVFQDIPEYERAVRNCVGALRPGGRLIFSLVHPCFEEPEAAWAGKRYVAVAEYLGEHVRAQAGGPPHFHRPLSAYVNLVIDSGCTIRRMVEPELRSDDPAHARGAHVPSFVLIHARRD